MGEKHKQVRALCELGGVCFLLYSCAWCLRACAERERVLCGADRSLSFRACSTRRVPLRSRPSGAVTSKRTGRREYSKGPVSVRREGTQKDVQQQKRVSSGCSDRA